MKSRPKRKQMGDLLVEAGVLKKVNLTEALNKQKNSNKRLGEILQEMGAVCEKDIALVLATQFNIRSAPPLTEQNLPQELYDIVNLQTAMARLICPISREGRRLNLAMANPLDLESIDDISFRTELDVIPWVATPSEILAAIRHHYLGGETANHKEECRILIVEDKDIVRAAAVSALKKEGYQLIEAKNGQEGLEAVLRHSPHLIITETVMPGMDGCEMFKALQRNPESRHIPVVGFSSKASMDEEIALLNMGFAGFLPKPINQELLTARVGRLLDLVYPALGFSTKSSQEAREIPSLYDAIHTLVELLQDKLPRK